MSSQKKYLMRIAHNVPIIQGSLFLATSSWEHIVDGHPEVDFPDLYETFLNPAVVHQDQSKANGILVVGRCARVGSKHPLRVAVKANLPDGNFVQTAFYSSDPPAGKILWQDNSGEEGEDKNE